ncbi:C-type lectin 37Da [Aedes aegypti]
MNERIDVRLFPLKKLKLSCLSVPKTSRRTKMLTKGITLILLLVLVHSSHGDSTPNRKFYIPSIRANWFKANEFCNSLKMRLVAIRSQEDNDAVARYVRTTSKFTDNCSFWIGASDLADEGTFVWVATGEEVTYTNWRENEPNNEGGNEDCIQLAYIPALNYHWSWNDNTCAGQSLYFICESVECDCVQPF